jgi:VIT1/CCC1 family predicted Fe2+/Mn2+ transporter
MGVAGAHSSNTAILVAGVAGTLAGAGAMAMGEWLSVQSARELAQRQIAIERDELQEAPEEEQEELSLIYQAKGLMKEEAETLAAKLMADKDNVLDTLAREELGIDPAELGGSAWEAAITSFVLFFAGAIAPVAPFLFLSGTAAIVTSLAASGFALFLIGAAITLLTGRGVLYSGLRQLLIGMAAAGVTFGIGRLIGVSVG